MSHYSRGSCKAIAIMESAVLQDIRENYCLHNPDFPMTLNVIDESYSYLLGLIKGSHFRAANM